MLNTSTPTLSFSAIVAGTGAPVCMQEDVMGMGEKAHGPLNVFQHTDTHAAAKMMRARVA